MLKQAMAVIISAAIISAGAVHVSAVQPNLGLAAESAILIEQTTGKVLYAKDENKRLYPASMTKILSALVAVDYLKPGDFITLGDELRQTPADSSKANLQPGETILFENLLRGLLIKSGNDAGCAIAYCVAKKVKGVDEMGYGDAESLFADLMNKKAAALGAAGSHFTNPHGYHDENHYSTARDIALFSRAFMGSPLLAGIVDEQTFDKKGAGDNPPKGALNIEHDWMTHNKLIMTGDVNYYTYANGIKTGFTAEAGNCVAASAKNPAGTQLISVVFNSPEPGLWDDSKALLNYGFDNFAFADVQKPGGLLEQAVIDRPRLGGPVVLDILGGGGFRDFFNKADLALIKREITYDQAVLAPPGPSGERPPGAPVLQAPIAKGQVLGKVTYSLGGQAIYAGEAVAASDVAKRTIGSDFNYYWHLAKTHLFIMGAVPYWAGGAVILAALIITLVARRKRKRRSRGFSMYRWR